MSINNVSEQVHRVLWTNEKIALFLWENLLPSRNQDNAFFTEEEFLIEFRELLIDLTDLSVGQQFRLNDIRVMVEKIIDDRFFASNNLAWIKHIFTDLMSRNGDFISYRPNKVKEFIDLAGQIDPSIVAAFHLNEWVNSVPTPSKSNIEKVVSKQSSVFSPYQFMDKQYAENHIHYGGVANSTRLLLDTLIEDNQKKTYHSKAYWFRNNNKRTDKMLSIARDALVKLLSYREKNQLSLDDVTTPMKEKLSKKDWAILNKIHHDRDVTESLWLVAKFAEAYSLNIQNAWIWLQMYCASLYQSNRTSPEVRRLIFCFWVSTNALRKSMLMRGHGLTRFSERAYDAPLRAKSKNATKDIVNALFSGKHDVVEFKGMPHQFKPEAISDFCTELLAKSGYVPTNGSFIFEDKTLNSPHFVNGYIAALERWQFCGHFVRTKKEKGTARSHQKGIWKKAKELDRQLRKTSGWNSKCFSQISQDRNIDFQPSNWFRGLDVAGDENDLKIELFAPALRWLRKRSNSNGSSQDFHFSIHAGEDYAHPVSGLRHIDETVRFCEMKSGDRLGHALALGVSPKDWIKKQGQMTVALDDHLDNLIWLWHYATKLLSKLEVAPRVKSILENRLTFFLNEFSNDCQRINDSTLERYQFSSSYSNRGTPNLFDLVSAWKLRRNCPYLYFQLENSSPLTELEREALPDWSVIIDRYNEAAELFITRHLYLNNVEKKRLVVIEAGDELDYGLFNSQQTSLLKDTISDVELEFIFALQEYLMDKYQRLGLLIETNPTSNVYIARLDDYFEHPIFRFSPPDEKHLASGGIANKFGFRRGANNVLINTDDPGVMPTDLRTEYALIFEAAMTLGFSTNQTESWLDKIRRSGVEQFKQNHEPVFSVRL